MRLTFEGPTLGEIFDEIDLMLLTYDRRRAAVEVASVGKPEDFPAVTTVTPVAVQGSSPQGSQEKRRVQGSQEKRRVSENSPPPEKPKKPAADKQAIAERMANMRAIRDAKKAARAAASASTKLPQEASLAETAGDKPGDKPAEKSVEERAQELIDKPRPVLDPAELVVLRTKTIAELQAAYAGGKHQEVLELLSRFGNGAKSFRELQADAFVPIREAIELGALT